jgi:CubicO group peptidase (beta-lactamase class C family)
MRDSVLTLRLVVPILAVLLFGSCTPHAQEDHSLESKIDSIVGTFLAQELAPSYAVGIRVGEGFVLTRGYGLAGAENEVPAKPETVYRIASLTKQFTAVAILQLVERGLLRLEDDLEDYLPAFRAAGNQVTIHHLLTHTSGVRNYTGLPAFQEKARLDLSHDDLVALIEAEPLDFVPGEAQRYSNSGYFLLGMIIEAVSGQAYAEYLEENIFNPLGMTESGYCNSRDLIRNRARGYSREGQELVNAEPISMVNPFSAGGLCSTVEDLLTWQDALNRRQVLSEDSFQKMTRPATLDDGTETPFGYGVVVTEFDGYQKYAFRGGISGFGSALTYTPELDLTIAVLTNSDEADPVELEVALARMIAEWETGGGQEPAPGSL